MSPSTIKAFSAISASIQPIRIITWLGAIVFGISLIMIIYSLISFFCGWSVSGWSSLLCSIWAIGGLQLLAIGVIGEYIGKIYMEVKHRPRYIISERTEVKDTSNSHKKVHY